MLPAIFRAVVLAQVANLKEWLFVVFPIRFQRCRDVAMRMAGTASSGGYGWKQVLTSGLKKKNQICVQTFGGSFSAVSTRIFATKYSSLSIFQAPQDATLLHIWNPRRKTTKSHSFKVATRTRNTSRKIEHFSNLKISGKIVQRFCENEY